jgi:hypothetical protein
MPNSDEKDSQADTESFVGIATGLIGFMETVHIKRDSKGVFLWPTGLPRSVPSKSLTVAANVLKYGTGAINVDGCRIDSIGYTGGGQNNTVAFRGGGGSKQDRCDGSKGRWPANVIVSYNEDEYKLRETVTPQQLKRLSEWLCENT